MTWVLWDILIPLITAFGLGTLLGWALWRWRQADGTIDSDIADAMAFENNETTQVDVNTNELAAANVVLIQERDNALNELETLRIESEELQARVQESEGPDNQFGIVQPDTSARDPFEVAAAEAESKKQAEQITQLTQDLEQRTIAYQEVLKASREADLELLNLQNQLEKLEVRSQDGSADNDLQTEHEEELKRFRVLRTEFETLEVNHAKLQAELEESKSASLQAEALRSDDTKDQEIAELKSSLDAMKAKVASPSVSIERHQQEIGSRDVQIESLKRKLANQSVVSMPVSPKPVQEPESNQDDSAEASPSLSDTVESSAPKTTTSKATKSGYVPAGWSVPDTKPGKKDRDELTDIKGVGPVLEKLLHESGIFYFQQVAELDKEGIDELQQQIPQFPNRIRRDQWVKQAKKLHLSKHGTAVA